ncbi:MAG: TonB-dependent receptor plug domain-containing protein [Bacillota bacterium]|nr:TonB-dependent receptor plug domain-containing protein [Bacillota bacterium]
MKVLCSVILFFIFTCFSQEVTLQSHQLTAAHGKKKEQKKSLKKNSVHQPLPIEKGPVLISFVKPAYPVSLSRRGIIGTITCDILINESGKVDSVYLISGISPQFDSLLVRAFYNATFSPAIAGGKPVPVLITYQYLQNLDDALSRIKEHVNFSGQLLEKGTRKTIPNAPVYLFYKDTAADLNIEVPFSMYLQAIGAFKGQSFSDGVITTFTDSAGYFNFKSLPFGPVSVRIQESGYEPFDFADTIAEATRHVRIYRLKKQTTSSYEIIVYGKKESDEVSKHSLNRDEIRKLPGFNGDALKVVQALPGVARPSFGGGTISVRGAPGWDSKYYLDGIPIPQLYHFGGLKSTYNSEMLEQISLYPGSYGVRFGNSIAGVIELTSRNAQDVPFKGFTDVNMFDASDLIEGTHGKKGGVIASVRRSYVGNLLGVIAKKSSPSEFPIITAPYYYDFVVKGNFNLTPKHTFTFTVFGSKDQLKLIIPTIQAGNNEVTEFKDRIENKVAFTMCMASYEFSLNANWKNNLKTAVVLEDGMGAFFAYAKWNYTSNEFYIKDDLTCKFSKTIKLVTGIDLWWQRYNQKAILPSMERTFLRDTLNNLFGLISPYEQFEFNPIPKLFLITGLRFDYYRGLDYNGSIIPEFWDYKSKWVNNGTSGEPSLRFSGRYELSSNHALTCAIGTYNQTPQPLGIATHNTLGDPNLPATKARHFAGGYQCQIHDRIFADAQVYFNQQWDIPILTLPQNYLINPDVPLYTGNGKGYMYGLELFIRHNLNQKFSGWLSYSLSRSKRFNYEENKYVLYEKDQTHNIQLFLNYQFRKNWAAGSRIRYTSGNPYTPVVDRIYDATNRYYQPIYGPEYSERNGPYFGMDLRLNKKIIFNNWVLNCYLDLQNVMWFLYKSPEYTLYNYDYTQKTTVSFPCIPSIGIRAEF